MAIQIQTILFKPSFKTQYWMKKDNHPAKKISKSKWFDLYDQPGTKILGPLTKERR